MEIGASNSGLRFEVALLILIFAALPNRTLEHRSQHLYGRAGENLIAALRSDAEVHKHIAALETATSDGRIPPSVAAAQLLDIFLGKHKK